MLTISSKKVTSLGSSSSAGWDRVGGSVFVAISVEIILAVFGGSVLVRLALGFLLWLGVGEVLQGGAMLRAISG